MARWVWENENKNEGVPNVLFKYYSLWSLELVLKDNLFKWEVPSKENDPFEALANGWDEEAIHRENENALAEGLPQINQEDADAIFKSKYIQDKISTAVAFLSFAQRSDNILMWSHYADKHSGVCIEYDTNILIEKVAPFQHVKYAKEECGQRKRIPLPPDARGDNNPEYQEKVKEFLSYKANEWAYEEEWRLILSPRMNSAITIKTKNDNPILVSEIPEGAIKCLIFGCNTPESTRLSLAKHILRNHPNCEFAETTPDKNLFELHIESIDIKDSES